MEICSLEFLSARLAIVVIDLMLADLMNRAAAQAGRLSQIKPSLAAGL